MAKDLITIGLQLANQEYHSLSERISLQDYDIVVFYPSMPSYGYDTDSQGSQSLTYTDSSRYHEDVSHWRTELSNAFVDSKTVFIFLPAMRTFDVKTGAPQTKGRVTTHHVSTRDNYSYLPMRIDGMKNASGNKINFLGNPAFADFWSDYKSELTYENYFENDYGSSVFTTKGGRSVGTLKLLDNGYLVALPLLNFEKDHFTKYKAGEEYWTDEATQFSKRFIQHIVQIDRAIRAEDQATPMPEWVSKTADSQKSKAIEQALVTNSAEIEALITVKEQLRGGANRINKDQGLTL